MEIGQGNACSLLTSPPRSGMPMLASLRNKNNYARIHNSFCVLGLVKIPPGALVSRCYYLYPHVTKEEIKAPKV